MDVKIKEFSDKVFNRMMSEVSKETFNAIGIVVVDEHNVMILPAANFLKNANPKATFLNGISQAAQQLNATAAILITEIKLHKINVNDIQMKRIISDDKTYLKTPKQSALMLFVVDKNGDQYTKAVAIKRQKNNITLEEGNVLLENIISDCVIPPWSVPDNQIIH